MKTYLGDFRHANSYLVQRFNLSFLVDPTYRLDEIKKDLGETELSFILLTHAHSDHTGLLGEFNVPIYLHKEDAFLLFADEYNGYYPNRHPYKKNDLDLRYVDHGDKIPFADGFIDVFHTPGHTKGSISFLYEQKLFCGDTLFKGSVGRHDLYSGHLPDLKKSVMMLMELPGQIKVYPGHDLATTIREEYKSNPFYLKWKKQKNG